MMSFVANRKRKDDHNMTMTSPDKGKVRILEETLDGTHQALSRFPRFRSSLPNTRTFSNIRRGSFRIFSVFRGGKGKHLI